MWEQLPALQSELVEFENRLRSVFERQGRHAYLDSLSMHLVDGGGKRLRPALTIAAAQLNTVPDAYDRERAMRVAMGLEMLHTATLVHDDIIDNAAFRRGRPTVSAQKGVDTAVFTGDYLFVKSIQMLASANLPMEKLTEAAQAVEEICIGEVAQFTGRGSIPSFKSYLSRITRKTAVLFAASCSLGAYCAKLSDEQVQAAGRYGLYLGIAFQISDDLLDLSGDVKNTGKPILSDLKEGVITLPILFAAASDPSFRVRIESLYDSPVLQSPATLVEIAQDAAVVAGLVQTRSIRTRYLQKAEKMLDRLPESEGKRLLHGILSMQPH